MAYPTNLDVFTTKVDGQDDILAAHMNAVQAALVAVETEIGLGLRGSVADLATRLGVAVNNDGTLKTAAIVPGAGSITHSMLAVGAVQSDSILDATITGADIAPTTIAGSNLQNGTVGTPQLANLAVTTPILANSAVTGVKASAPMATRQVQTWLGTIPTTGSVECALLVPANATITGLKLVSKDSLVGSDSNYIAVAGTDMGSNGLGATVVTLADATDTTKLTGGTNGVVAYGSTSFGVTGGAVLGNDVLKFVFTVTGTLPNTLTNCVVAATFLITT